EHVAFAVFVQIDAGPMRQRAKHSLQLLGDFGHGMGHPGVERTARPAVARAAAGEGAPARARGGREGDVIDRGAAHAYYTLERLRSATLSVPPGGERRRRPLRPTHATAAIAQHPPTRPATWCRAGGGDPREGARLRCRRQSTNERTPGAWRGCGRPT